MLHGSFLVGKVRCIQSLLRPIHFVNDHLYRTMFLRRGAQYRYNVHISKSSDQAYPALLHTPYPVLIWLITPSPWGGIIVGANHLRGKDSEREAK